MPLPCKCFKLIQLKFFRDWEGEMLCWLILGGSVNNGTHAGLFAFNVNNAPSNANWNNGAS